MRIPNSTKTKMLGACAAILGLSLFCISVFEVRLGKVNISSKVGTGEITATHDPYFFWLLIILELIGGSVSAGSGTLMILNKLAIKWKD